MRKRDFELLVKMYGEEKARQALAWFASFPKGTREAVYPVRFIVTNEMLWG